MRRAYVGVENFKRVELPAGYTQVEYIESSGTQYINTLISPSGNLRVKMDCQLTAATHGATMFGTRNNSSGMFLASWNNDKAMWEVAHGSAWHEIDAASSALDRVVVEVAPTGAIIGGHYVSWGGSSFTSTYPVLLFARYSSGTVDYKTSMKCYSCEIYDGDALIRNYIPCINASGVAGLYDLVGGLFYGNAGTGSFAVGTSEYKKYFGRGKKIYVGVEQASSMLPDGYTELEYIQSSGSQWIDTGYKVNSNLRIVMDAQFTSTSANQSFFGGRTSGSSLDAMWIGWNGSNIFADYTNYYRLNYSAYPTNRITLEMNKNVCTVNGETQTFTAHTFTSNYNLALFALNNGGAFIQLSSMKLYSCQIYDNGTIVRDFVPCKNSGGAVGLYDFVGKSFYANKGSGSFSAGTEAPKLPAEGARFVKKGYVSIGRKARPFWGDQKIVRYGKIDSLGVARQKAAAFCIGDYAVIGGGESCKADVDAYASDLTKVSVEALKYGRANTLGISNDSYGIFVGGDDMVARSVYDEVEAYTPDLVRLDAPNLRVGVEYPGGTRFGDLMVVSGGSCWGDDGTRSTAVVDAYTDGLTRVQYANMKSARHMHFGAANNYAIFGSGINGSAFVHTVEAFDSSMTRLDAPESSYNRQSGIGVSFGKYVAVIGSGKGNPEPIETYDNDLVRMVPATLGVSYLSGHAAEAVGDFIVVAGGRTDSGDYRPTVEAYDKDFVRLSCDGLETGRSGLVAVRNKNNILFCGGRNSGLLGDVDVYSLVDAY